MKSMDARDTLTVVLLTARRRGIVIEELRFRVGGSLTPTLAALIQDVREDLQALEGQLARCEEMARREAVPA
jgi:hypothetical protein